MTVTLVKIHFLLGSHMKMNMPRISSKFKLCYLQEITHGFSEWRNKLRTGFLHFHPTFRLTKSRRSGTPTRMSSTPIDSSPAWLNKYNYGKWGRMLKKNNPSEDLRGLDSRSYSHLSLKLLEQWFFYKTPFETEFHVSQLSLWFTSH